MWPFSSHVGSKNDDDDDCCQNTSPPPTPPPTPGSYTFSETTPEHAQEMQDKYMAQKYAEFKEACLERKLPEGCNSLAEWYLVVGKDANKAAQIYEENCQRRNFGPSCLHLGFMKLTGAKGLCEVDEDEAARMFEKACKMRKSGGGVERACHNAALMVLANKGTAIGAPPAPPADTTEQEAADKTKKQPLTKKQVQMAIERLGYGCDAQFAPSCFRLGTLLLTEGKCKDAIKPLTDGCDLGNPRACQNLAVLYNKGGGEGWQKVQPNAEQFDTFRRKTEDLMKENHMRG